MNKMYLVLGDWSEDGHGESNKVLVDVNKELSEVQEAYKASCKLTGISFNHNEDYTGTNRDFSQRRKFQIASQYEDSSLSEEVMGVLLEYGFDVESLSSYEGGETVWLNDEDFIELWFWFVGLSLDGLMFCLVDDKDEIPCINGYWNDNLNVQFGYGLYS